MSESASHPTRSFVTAPAPPGVTAPESARATAALAAPEASQRAIALVADTTIGPDGEMLVLLRSRLRQVVLLFLAAYAAFLIRDLTAPTRIGMHYQKVMFLIVTPLQLLLVAITWSPWANSLNRVRAVELAVLGIFCIAVGSIQFYWLCDWDELELYISGPDAMNAQVMVGNTWVVPWFALIAGYPVIVPNPLRRALSIAGTMALLPYIVTVAAVLTSPRGWNDTWMMFVTYTIWLPLAVGFAVYGSHQAGLLRRQAYEAKRFGQYRLMRRLGEGGMGEVYLAEHLLLRRPSVIKIIRRDRSRDPAVLSRFEREVQILATLNHWNTVAVFDYGYTAEGTFYFVMEYLPGLDLDELVNKHGPLPPGRVVHLLRQLCAALNEAHTAGLIHRDVKPSNVMVCRRGCVPDVAKLLDFGLVQGIGPLSDSAPRLTTEGAIMGTPHYMSPEQAAGKPTDTRSDIYSLGATAYFLLTGRPPFDLNGIMEVIAAHLLQPAVAPNTLNPDVPIDLSDLVLRCLAKKPDDRFATIAELEAALAQCVCANTWCIQDASDWWAKCGSPEPPPPKTAG